MKTFKKALAVLLAVLMVAFSVPFTAVANDKWDPVVSLHVYNYSAPDTWGPFDTNEAGDDYAQEVTTLEAGSDYAVAFVLTGITQFQMIQLRSDKAIDTSIIQPVYYSYGNRGKLVVTYPAYGTINDPNKCFMNGLESNDVGEGTTFVDNPSYWSVDEVCIAKSNGLTPATVTGKTHFKGTFNPTAPDDFNGTYDMDGTLIQVIGLRAVKDISVEDLYAAFDFHINEVNNNFVRDEDKVDHALKFEPVSSGTTETEYTFTPISGDPVKVMVPEGTDPLTMAPPLTPDETRYSHDAEASTHTKNTYSWVADGANAYKEVKTADTQPCDNKVTDETNSTCKVPGYTEYTCSVCNYSYKDYKELVDHDFSKVVSSTAGDCQTVGSTTYECSYGCGQTKTVDGAYGAHKLVKHDAVASTCTVAGNSEYYTCSVCGKMFSDAGAANEISAIPALPLASHTFTNYKNNNDATCQKNATETATCDVCGTATDTREIADSTVAHQFTVEVSSTPGTCVAKATTTYSCAFGCGTTDVVEGALDPSNHAGSEVSADNAVAPTRKDAGKEADTICSACKAVIKEGAVIPALGVNVTVAGSALGTVTINDEAISNDVKNLAYASSYTLKATPAENAEFVGWMVGNRIVSTETTYTTNAYADVTYVPVFAEKSASTFTVTFMDSYGNVVKTVSSADLPLAELPEATQYAGLVFDSWSMTLDQVNDLTDSATVYANYKNDEVQTYTINADNCTITIDGVDYPGTATATYNTKVTVKANDGAEKTWKVNGAVAGFGAEYTFYCGSDVTITTEDVVAAKPVVSAVSMTKANGSYRVKFLATRSIPDGYKLVESGFVYGKAMAAEDLVLENVGKVVGTDNGTLKQMVCSNTSGDGQFAVNYGVKAMNQTACARAYIIYTDGVKTTVDYSEAMIYTY